LGSEDFAQMWSGQSAHLGQELPAGAITKRLAEETLAKLGTFTRIRWSPRGRPVSSVPRRYPRWRILKETTAPGSLSSRNRLVLRALRTLRPRFRDCSKL